MKKCIVFAGIIVVAFCFLATQISCISVSGRSMEPSYEDGSIVFYYKPAEINRGDVVLLYNYDNGKEIKIMKRVMAKAGDMINTRHGNVYVNGKRIAESYCKGRTDIDDTIVPNGFIFILGDNRDISEDSRFFGCVSEKKVFGKVIDLPL